MPLSVKQKKIPLEKSISKALVETVTRVSYLTIDEYKKLKIKSVKTDVRIKELIDNSLQEVMSDQNHQFVDYGSNTKKHSFTINEQRLQEMKMFLIEQDNKISQDLLIYNAILKIIK